MPSSAVGQDAWLDDLRAYADQSGAAFIVHTGDICYEKGLRAHRTLMNAANMGRPVYYCIGNHDLVKGPYGEALFESLYGPTWYSFNAGGTHYVVLPMPGGDHRPSYSTREVAAWLRTFCKGLCDLFTEKRQDYRLQTVQRVQAYIDDNVSKKLSLGMVASIFGYSQNYLSSLFSRYASMSFVDYVNKAKVEKAKQLLADPNALVYEVASSLGFESPFYFSKVFKKETGLSPTVWQGRLKG